MKPRSAFMASPVLPDMVTTSEVQPIVQLLWKCIGLDYV